MTELDRAVIVAVVAIGMVEMPFYQIVDVIAVGNRLVAAVCPVFVLGIVTIALVAIRAVRRVGGIHV